MDEDIMAELKDFSKHIQGVGRMIGSTKITTQKLIAMKECLSTGSETLDIYLEIQKNRITD